MCLIRQRSKLPPRLGGVPHAKTLSLIREPSLQIIVPPSDGERKVVWSSVFLHDSPLENQPTVREIRTFHLSQT